MDLDPHWMADREMGPVGINRDLWRSLHDLCRIVRTTTGESVYSALTAFLAGSIDDFGLKINLAFKTLEARSSSHPGGVEGKDLEPSASLREPKTALKACPFCGSTEVHVMRNDHKAGSLKGMPFWQAECLDCSASTRRFFERDADIDLNVDETFEEASAWSWNRRALEAGLPAPRPLGEGPKSPCPGSFTLPQHLSPCNLCGLSTDAHLPSSDSVIPNTSPSPALDALDPDLLESLAKVIHFYIPQDGMGWQDADQMYQFQCRQAAKEIFHRLAALKGENHD